MKICFLENTNFEYSYKDIHSPILRGAENILINLSKQLSLCGHDITVFNNCNINIHNDKSNWFNINRIKQSQELKFDVAISNGDTKLLDKIKSKKNIVISYSLQTIEKFIRKGQLISYLRNKPTFFLIGEYHRKNRSKLISLFGNKILKLAIDEMFHKTILPDTKRENNAIFTSRGDRNLELLINIWNNNIFTKYQKGNLFVTPYKDIDQKNNIFFRNMSNRGELIQDLLKSKVYLIPGHKAELFCLAAAEAQELCIPIVTLGIGSLRERVSHNINGFIAKDYNEFSKYTIDLFENETLWLRLHQNMVAERGKNNWKNCAIDFINQIKSI